MGEWSIQLLTIQPSDGLHWISRHDDKTMSSWPSEKPAGLKPIQLGLGSTKCCSRRWVLQQKRFLLLIHIHLGFSYICLVQISLTAIMHTPTAKHSIFTLFTVLYAINQHTYNNIPSHIHIEAQLKFNFIPRMFVLLYAS